LYLGSPRVSPLLRHKSTFPGWRQRSGAPTEAIRAWLLAGAQDLEAVYAHLTELLFGRRLLGGSAQDHRDRLIFVGQHLGLRRLRAPARGQRHRLAELDLHLTR